MKDNVIQASQANSIASNKDNTELLQVIAYIISALGISRPTDADKSVLLDYIRTNLSDHSPAEIKIAYTMAMKGMFNMELREYPKITPHSLETVLGHYRKYRYEVVNSAQQDEQPKEAPDIDAIYKASLERLKMAYMENGEWAFDAEGNFDGKYQWLKSHGKFWRMSKEEAEEVKIQARQAWVRSLTNSKMSAKNHADAKRVGEVLKQVEAGRPVENEDVAIAYQGKRLMVIEWIKRLASGEVNLS